MQKKERENAILEKIKLSDRCKTVEEEARKLKKELQCKHSGIEESPASSSFIPKPITNLSPKSEAISENKTIRICVIGGSEAWRHKIQNNFPDIKCLGNQPNFDESVIRKSDFFIINTNFVGHSCTTKVQSIARAAKIKTVLMSKNNLEAFSRIVQENTKSE